MTHVNALQDDLNLFVLLIKVSDGYMYSFKKHTLLTYT